MEIEDGCIHLGESVVCIIVDGLAVPPKAVAECYQTREPAPGRSSGKGQQGRT